MKSVTLSQGVIVAGGSTKDGTSKKVFTGLDYWRVQKKILDFGTGGEGIIVTNDPLF